MQELLVSTPTHGRVLVRPADSPSGTLVGFHGYMENADTQMERLASLEGCDDWTLVSPQALNRFYKGRSQAVVASWMTRQDREVTIEDNIGYIDRVVAQVVKASTPIVFAGFSQGVAMAFRAAARGARKGAAVIAVGGDVPPELLVDASVEFPRVLLARGERDEWYTAAKLDADVAALNARGVNVESFVHSGGHEWNAEVSRAAGRFIASRFG
ncbi:phospholipase [soil metagenome]